MKTWMKPILFAGILAVGTVVVSDMNAQVSSYPSFKIHVASGGEEVELPDEIGLPPWRI